jgi:hypothetical protein
LIKERWVVLLSKVIFHVFNYKYNRLIIVFEILKI